LYIQLHRIPMEPDDMATATAFPRCHNDHSASVAVAVWSWTKRRPTDAILVIGWALFAVYLTIYLGTGAWLLPS
jgi:hypothetical protein